MRVTLIDLFIVDEFTREEQEKEKRGENQPRVHAPLPKPKKSKKEKAAPPSDRGIVVIDIMGEE